MRRLFVIAALLASAGGVALAQRRGYFDGAGRDPAIHNAEYEDNDPKKRLQMIINYNTDISQFWEWSGRGLRPVGDTNEAYKLGVNYIIYGLTH